jgi:ADP-heptose:LPS heptosyltransferase
MGFGDDIIGTGIAKTALRRGYRAAFGNGRKIIWGPWSEEIFRHNRNIARPGDEQADDIEWINYYKGNRHYNKLNKAGTRWIWNYEFKAKPGEIFFDVAEKEYGNNAGAFFVVIEPNVPWHKSVAPNKDWGLQRYQQVANRLLLSGHDVVQFSHGRDRLQGVRVVKTPTFRHALAVLNRASLAVVPEGGLHHGAAALGIPAVVIFGGFVPPQVTGYAMHINLNGNAEACGSLARCTHCREALDRITVDEVCGHVLA